MHGRILAAGLCVAALAAGARVGGEPPRVPKEKGHSIPLMAGWSFTGADAPAAKGMVCGVLLGNKVEYSRHDWPLTGAGGTSVRVWLDTIAEVKGIDAKELTVVFKGGEERTFRHDGGSFIIHHANDTKEYVPFVKLKQIKFLHAPRKDKEGRAMFDEWRYSPYTGEKLLPVTRAGAEGTARR
jgi:hypothetical protein